MEFLLWIVFGGIAGWLASLIMGTDKQQGILLNVVVGIFGAVLGGWLMSFFGQSSVSGFNLYSIIVAVFGAVVLLFIVQTVRRA